VDAAELRKAAASSIGRVAERRGRASRWHIASRELTWVIELDRGASWSPWALALGCAVRSWRADDDVPRVAGCDVQIDYAMLPSGVPDAALGTRFDDHRSYFTMVFQHAHDLVDDGERIEAFQYCADDVRGLATRLATVAALRQAVRDGVFASGFVDRRLLA
jgi:hypothetical protein